MELSGRIMKRLEDAERAEINPHFCDDYRIAWITTLYAARGEAIPQVRATYTVLGIHPDSVFVAMSARRKAKLGREYDKFYDVNGVLISDLQCECERELPSPKKPVQSVHPLEKESGVA